MDDDNRLPRGRTYANSGVVKHLVVKGRVVGSTPRFKDGSRPRPYTISLSPVQSPLEGLG